MKIKVNNYTFDKTAKTVTFSDYQSIRLDSVLLITNVTTGVIIYLFSDPAKGGSVSNNVLTLDYDTSAMSNSDSLQIYYDDDIDVQDQLPIAVSPAITGQQDLRQSMPVALANQQVFDLQSPMISQFTPQVGFILAQQDCLQYRSVAVQITTGAGISAGVVSFEGSNGGAESNTWAAVTLIDLAASTPVGATSLTLAASANRYFSGPLHFRYFRVRVSTAVAGGMVSCLALFRMVPYANPLITGFAGMNVAQIAGNTAVTAGVNGLQAVGGNIAPGTAPTANPLPIGGIDLTGLTRRILTDIFGQQVIIGADPQKTAQTPPVKTKHDDGVQGRNTPTELLEMILMELKLNNYYLKELPMMLNRPNGNFIEEISDFVNNQDKVNN